ncbi:hypothetical protein, partial [Pectobacterium brasiliense]|uniref:hypothetical protein n=1 Tax=Pectobacterium brasiliense TaxID=180957 RepID=UPI001C5D68B2
WGFCAPNHDEIRQVRTKHPLRAIVPIGEPVYLTCGLTCFAIFLITPAIPDCVLPFVNPCED